jgi:Tfp pilus assembly protein FimT
MKKKSGFTLIELVLVCVLLLVMINISIPLFRNTFYTIRIENSLRDVSQVVRYLHTRSVVEGIRYKMNFDYQNGIYWAELEEKSGYGSGAFRTMKERIGGKHKLSGGVSMEGDETEIFFYPDGRIDDAEVLFKDTSGLRYSLEISGSDVRIEDISGETG